jgi:orotate phosphoribosyltransferase
MNGNNIEESFKEYGAILKGHFVLKDSQHSDSYLEKAILYRNPILFEDICLAMTREVCSRFTDIEAVVGPAPIGAVLAQRVAFHLGEVYGKTVVPLFTEKDENNRQVLRRNFGKDLALKNVLIVDDIMTSGSSVMDIIRAVVISRGQVKTVAIMCNRCKVPLDRIFQLSVISLSTIKLQAWFENDCPLCRTKVPITADVGHGREFLKLHPDYPSK